MTHTDVTYFALGFTTDAFFEGCTCFLTTGGVTRLAVILFGVGRFSFSLGVPTEFSLVIKFTLSSCLLLEAYYLEFVELLYRKVGVVVHEGVEHLRGSSIVGLIASCSESDSCSVQNLA